MQRIATVLITALVLTIAVLAVTAWFRTDTADERRLRAIGAEPMARPSRGPSPGLGRREFPVRPVRTTPPRLNAPDQLGMPAPTIVPNRDGTETLKLRRR